MIWISTISTWKNFSISRTKVFQTSIASSTGENNFRDIPAAPHLEFTGRSSRPFGGPSTSSGVPGVDGDSGYGSSSSSIRDSRGVQDASIQVDYSSEGRLKVHSYGFDNRTVSTSTAHVYFRKKGGRPLVDRKRGSPYAERSSSVRRMRKSKDAKAANRK